MNYAKAELYFKLELHVFLLENSQLLFHKVISFQPVDTAVSVPSSPLSTVHSFYLILCILKGSCLSFLCEC